MVERGTLPGQRTVRAPLADIAAAAQAAEVAPAVGHRGRRRRRAGARSSPGSSRGPLSGRRVAVTRARAQASGLAARLRVARRRRRRGAGDPDRAARRPRRPTSTRYDLVCLTSPNGVRLLFERLHAAGRDARALAGATVAAIGPGTARALREHGVIADVVPERFVAEALVEALAGRAGRAGRSSRARARPATSSPTRCASAGAEVDVLALYETVAEPLDDEQRAAALGGRLRDVHLVVDRALLPRGGRRRRGPLGPPRLDRAGDERRRCASTDSSRTSRRAATTWTGSSRRWSPTRPAARWRWTRPARRVLAGKEPARTSGALSRCRDQLLVGLLERR